MTGKDKIAHFVAPFDQDETFTVDAVRTESRKGSRALDTWRFLRRRADFWISTSILFILLLATFFPIIFTRVPPNSNCLLQNSNGGPRGEHILGFTKQGCDVFSRIVYGTSTSLSVGVLALIFSLAIGITIGAVAGFAGGWLDSIFSRCMDIFFVIPFLVAAIVVMSAFSNFRNVLTISIVLAVFGWSGSARIVRAEVMRVKNLEFIQAAKALGQKRISILFKHIIPNSLGPIYSLSAFIIGGNILTESVLSFLGIGLPSNVMSWGNDIASAQPDLRSDPFTLFWPSLVLTVTILAFTLLGEVIRRAGNPKARVRRK